MAHQDRFGMALRLARKARSRTQEDFSITSSRTYVSMLERGVRSPTLAKINELAETLEIHPLTLLMLAYADAATPANFRKIVGEVEREALSLMRSEERGTG